MGNVLLKLPNTYVNSANAVINGLDFYKIRCNTTRNALIKRIVMLHNHLGLLCMCPLPNIRNSMTIFLATFKNK